MDTIIFKIDKKLKEKAQKQAQKGGFSLSDYYRHMTVSLAEGKTRVGIIEEPQFNAKTAHELRLAFKDIREGKNLSPAFKTIKEMREYLEN